MARWSNATLVALGGFDKNVIIDELLYGEDNYYDITFLSDTLRTVVSISGAVVTFTKGDNSVFQVGDYIAFGSSSLLYLISAVGTSTITLATVPNPVPVNLDSIQVPINLTSATFQFRLLEHIATITDDTRAGVTIGDITPQGGATVENLDNNVITNVPGQSLALGQLRVIVNANNFSRNPIIDDTQPPFYTGFIGVTLPAVGSTPVQTKKQRICFVVRADGVNS